MAKLVIDSASLASKVEIIMAILLNSLFVVFEISFLPNYCVKYYDYIIKWCSGVACNWCLLLDFGLILALRLNTLIQPLTLLFQQLECASNSIACLVSMYLAIKLSYLILTLWQSVLKNCVTERKCSYCISIV